MGFAPGAQGVGHQGSGAAAEVFWPDAGEGALGSGADKGNDDIIVETPFAPDGRRRFDVGALARALAA